MPSRKRAKGKERKAKAAEPKVSRWEILSRWSENNVTIQCSHSCKGKMDLVIPPASSPPHPVHDFMSAVYAFDGPARPQWYDIMKLLYQQYSPVWKDDDHRKSAQNILLAFGTNSILRDGTYAVPNIVSAVLLVLEHFNDSKDFESAFWSAAPKIRDITYMYRSDRDALKFYSKRIRCSCLKERYAQTKGRMKKGECHNCRKVLERKELMVCSRCNVNQYCSDKCHREAWTAHKKWCDKVVNSKKDA